mgnify:CR=1 FL=1
MGQRHVGDAGVQHLGRVDAPLARDAPLDQAEVHEGWFKVERLDIAVRVHGLIGVRDAGVREGADHVDQSVHPAQVRRVGRFLHDVAELTCKLQSALTRHCQNLYCGQLTASCSPCKACSYTNRIMIFHLRAEEALGSEVSADT